MSATKPTAITAICAGASNELWCLGGDRIWHYTRDRWVPVPPLPPATESPLLPEPTQTGRSMPSPSRQGVPGDGNLKKLTRAELAEALRPTYNDFYSQLSKSQQQQVTFDQAVDGSYQLLHSGDDSETAATRPSRIAVAERAGISSCVVAVGVVVADVLGIVFQIVGVNAEESRAAARALLGALGEDTIRGIQATIHDLKSAESALDKAKLMWKVVSEVKNAVGFSGIVKALKDTFKWYDWIISGVTIVAQLTAWFATDGVALIAELALEAVYLAQFTEDVIAAQEACS